ncbi:hypothetical protein XOC_4168 [Xanthomonas oryzae pv. oryzicola BLS256]|uniref:Uncharacterized protein n=1 Tax=Xanthomonas oryzae pv. oryzicola (strain BLS256) TaxID=383407 RepID=G7TKA7_XANOB|nr:hypothetical protein XOC_4168 [Xanthomonas oryzae pv. oryzicola BLS256]QEO95558.1 hypothetical protein XOCgx_0564 [Xanthomonas oryzae pv. oryzicola]
MISHCGQLPEEWQLVRPAQRQIAVNPTTAARRLALPSH